MDINKDFNFSYWELKQYFQTFDLVVIGSGIVGLSTAISFKEKNKKAKILILERGFLPNGASTKNAGFACFGSAGELLDDLKNIPEKIVWETLKMRWEGLSLLRSRLKDKNLAYKAYGGFELFRDIRAYEECKDQIHLLNKEIKSRINMKNCYSPMETGKFPFASVAGVIKNQYEGQLDTALMIKNLLLLARKKEIEILNTVQVDKIVDTNQLVEIYSNKGVFKAQKVVVATNGFARELLKLPDVKPARAQVLITKPIANLSIKGAFHFLNGYYYFRDIDNRILFGGGRNLDLKVETTTNQGLNKKIQKELEHLLKTVILPGTNFEIDKKWSGIMGVGKEKKPIIYTVGKNTIAAVRMGGMGIAIGSFVGEKAAQLID